MHQRFFKVLGLLNQRIHGVLVTAGKVLALVVEPWMGFIRPLFNGLKFAICPSDGGPYVAVFFT